MITIENITDSQIRQLRSMLIDEGRSDSEYVETCTVALWKPLTTSDRMFINEPYRSAALKADNARLLARVRCVEMLNARNARQGAA